MQAPTIYVRKELSLPDLEQWQFRFNVQSETSDRLYTIAQHKTKKHWGCSCPGWKAHRTCKHLKALNIPGHEKPYEINLVKE
jgi:hypothetical protein